MRPGTLRDIGAIAETMPAGELLVLVGDWAIDFWVQALGIRREGFGATRASIEFSDAQLLAPAHAALVWARATGNTILLAISEDERSRVAALVTAHASDRTLSFEFVSGLPGIPDDQLEQVRQSAMPIVWLPGKETVLYAMHPVHALWQQLEATYGYPLGRRNESDGERHVVLVELAIEACRRITLRHLKQGEIADAVRIVEAVHKISLGPAALRARLTDGVQVEQAIVESDAFPKEFRKKRLRHFRRVHKRKVYVYRRRFSHLAVKTAGAVAPNAV